MFRPDDFARVADISHSPAGGSAAPAPQEELMRSSYRPHLTLAPLEDLTEPELPCQLEDPQLWFSEYPADLEQAKGFCAGCPVREACLAGALHRREYWGVWGGEIFDQGNVVAFKRARGRPRKHPLPAPSAQSRIA
jgi:WhiB family redox-sensing transcriptional regulator